MAYVLNKTVVLVGMMGAGKTAVGTALAQSLGVNFRDSDAEIELAANQTISEIFKRDGEDFFRRRETEILSRLLDRKPGILSTGGGAYLSSNNRRIISKKGVAVWLRADLNLLWSRVRNKNTRPLLQTENPYETLAQLCTQREPSYAKADICVTSKPKLSIDGMADQVIRALANHPGILEKR